MKECGVRVWTGSVKEREVRVWTGSVKARKATSLD